MGKGCHVQSELKLPMEYNKDTNIVLVIWVVFVFFQVRLRNMKKITERIHNKVKLLTTLSLVPFIFIVFFLLLLVSY